MAAGLQLDHIKSVVDKVADYQLANIPTISYKMNGLYEYLWKINQRALIFQYLRGMQFKYLNCTFRTIKSTCSYFHDSLEASIHFAATFVTLAVTLHVNSAMGFLPVTENCGLRFRQECREPFPRHRLQRKPLIRDPGMHYGTCVTHVPCCMSGSLTCRGRENVSGIPGACATCNFPYLVKGTWLKSCVHYKVWDEITYTCPHCNGGANTNDKCYNSGL